MLHLSPAPDATGVFTRTLAWLHHRNRLHSATQCLAANPPTASRHGCRVSPVAAASGRSRGRPATHLSTRAFLAAPTVPLPGPSLSAYANLSDALLHEEGLEGPAWPVPDPQPTPAPSQHPAQPERLPRPQPLHTARSTPHAAYTLPSTARSLFSPAPGPGPAPGPTAASGRPPAPNPAGTRTAALPPGPKGATPRPGLHPSAALSAAIREADSLEALADLFLGPERGPSPTLPSPSPSHSPHAGPGPLHTLPHESPDHGSGAAGAGPHAGPTPPSQGGAVAGSGAGAGGWRWGTGHVSAALARLPHTRELQGTAAPRLAGPRAEALLEGLLARFERHRRAGLYGTRELSSATWVLGKLGRCERSAQVRELAANMLALHRRHTRVLARAEAKAAAGVKRAGGAAGAQAGEQAGAQVDRGAAPRHESSPGAAGAAGGAQGTTAGLLATGAMLGVPAEADALAEADARAPGLTGGCSHQDLSNMALGLAKTGVTDPALWRQLAEAAEPELRRLPTQELANLVWSLAQAHRAHCRASRWAPGVGDTAASGCGLDATVAPASASGSASASAPAAGASTAEGGVDTGRDAGSSARTPVGAGSGSPLLHPDWRPWLGPLLERRLAPIARARLRRLTGQQAANTAWALAALGHADVSTVAALAAEAEARARGLAPQAVCQLAWAMATMVRRLRAAAGGPHGAAVAASGATLVAPESRAGGAGGEPGSAAPLPSAAATVHGVDASAAAGAGGAVSPRQLAQLLDALGPACRALGIAAAARMRRFSPQGLSNLLWSLRELRYPARRRLLELAAAEAVVRVDALPPLALATLTEAWACVGLYHPGLFAAVGPAAVRRLDEFSSKTLVRLVCAYGRVGHVDRRLFAAVAAALTAAPGADRGAGAALEQAAAAQVGVAHAASRPGVLQGLDELSYDDLYGLACAYGTCGAGSAPWFLDELLARLAPLASPPMDAVAAIAAATAPDNRQRRGKGNAVEPLAVAAAAAAAAVGQPRLGPTEALKLAAALAAGGFRPAPASAGSSVDPSAASGAAAAGTVRSLRRLLLPQPAALSAPDAVTAVWALMRLGVAGPAAAMRLAERLCRGGGGLAALQAFARSPVAAADPRLLPRLVWVLGKGAAGAASGVVRSADGAAVASSAAAAAAASELAAAMLAVAGVVMMERDEPPPPDVLAALAESMAAVLAAAPPPPAASTPANGAAAAAAALYGSLHGAFLEVVDAALRRATAAAASEHAHGPAAAAAAARMGRRAPPPPSQSPSATSALAPRHVAAVAHAVCDSGMAGRQPLLRSAVARCVVLALTPPPSGASAAPSMLPPSTDDVARLLAAAARLELYDNPAAAPVLRTAAARLTSLGALPAPPPAAAAEPSTPPAAARRGRVPGVGAPDRPLCPVSGGCLLELLEHCRAALARIDAAASTAYARGAGGGGGGSGGAVVAALARWAELQATPESPWLLRHERAGVLAGGEAGMGMGPPAAASGPRLAAPAAADANGGSMTGPGAVSPGAAAGSEPQPLLTASAEQGRHEVQADSGQLNGIAVSALVHQTEVHMASLLGRSLQVCPCESESSAPQAGAGREPQASGGGEDAPTHCHHHTGPSERKRPRGRSSDGGRRRHSASAARLAAAAAVTDAWGPRSPLESWDEGEEEDGVVSAAGRSTRASAGAGGMSSSAGAGAGDRQPPVVVVVVGPDGRRASVLLQPPGAPRLAGAPGRC
ncbi:hypothetical protein HYH03_011779 [Edaphochlamys debaryana]|uniref:RAP domain-containing protein n=1 Tax=Edaphochlamys debaryana TaxID=47281 RepID=A0A835XV89_9CHLO|nr:hypothetical protein HYH03_011779 [Edaphochlamys debaryana]|eukprot:KAG2489668.1 hypothetical protein HYH03_011779 [Edaphochlamys debaryana]